MCVCVFLFFKKCGWTDGWIGRQTDRWAHTQHTHAHKDTHKHTCAMAATASLAWPVTCSRRSVAGRSCMCAYLKALTQRQEEDQHKGLTTHTHAHTHTHTHLHTHTRTHNYTRTHTTHRDTHKKVAWRFHSTITCDCLPPPVSLSRSCHVSLSSSLSCHVSLSTFPCVYVCCVFV